MEHAKEVTDRYLDADYGEQVNPWHLLNEHGKEIEGLDGEKFSEACENLGLSVKSDNTYNNSGNDTEDAGYIFDFQYDFIQNENDHTAKVFMVVMFHCGGDPRGNYTDKAVWEFSNVDDAYSVLMPYKKLTPESEDSEKEA